MSYSCYKNTYPSWVKEMGTVSDDPLGAALEKFTADSAYWSSDEDEGADRNERALRHAKTKATGRYSMVPIQFTNREDIFGGGLRRMTTGGVGPRREDENFYAPRYVPIGFGRYKSPIIDPADYRFERLGGWRVAIPRTVPGPSIRTLLLRIYHYGPSSAGRAHRRYVGPGDFGVRRPPDPRRDRVAIRPDLEKVSLLASRQFLRRIFPFFYWAVLFRKANKQWTPKKRLVGRTSRIR